MKSIIKELNRTLDAVQYGNITQQQLESSLEQVINELLESETNDPITII